MTDSLVEVRRILLRGMKHRTFRHWAARPHAITVYLETMCNDYEQHVAYAEYCRVMQRLGLGQPARETAAHLPLFDDVKIGDVAPVMRAAGNGIELTAMRFGFPSIGRGGPVFNFRSERRRFDKSKHCLIPASAFFEFTGNKYPKAKHRFSLNDAPFLAIAGIWRDSLGEDAPAFTMLTTEPGPDVAPIHNRQIVVVKPDDWVAWIDLTKPEADLLKPLPQGSLQVKTVRAGND